MRSLTQTDITYLVQLFPDMRTFLDRGCQTNSLPHGSSHNTLEALHLDPAAVRNYNRNLAAAVQRQQHLID